MRKTVIPLIILATLFIITPTVYAETVEVIVQNYEFIPKDITIKAGDTVKWIVKEGFHTVTSGSDCTYDGKFDSGMLVWDQVFTRVFKEPGTYPYFCDPHCKDLNMKGSVTVK